MTGADRNFVFDRLGPPLPITDPDAARGLLGELVDALDLRPVEADP